MITFDLWELWKNRKYVKCSWGYELFDDRNFWTRRIFYGRRIFYMWRTIKSFFQGFLQNTMYRCWVWDKPLPLWCENTFRCILLENHVDRPISGRNRPNVNFEIQNPQMKIWKYDENSRFHRFWSRRPMMTVDKVLESLNIILFENQIY